LFDCSHDDFHLRKTEFSTPEKDRGERQRKEGKEGRGLGGKRVSQWIQVFVSDDDLQGTSTILKVPIMNFIEKSICF
jgi:hypothetical protein